MWNLCFKSSTPLKIISKYVFLHSYCKMKRFQVKRWNKAFSIAITVYKISIGVFNINNIIKKWWHGKQNLLIFN